MNDANLCRENILHTYLRLAESLEDVAVLNGPKYDSCTSDVPLALCNFAINFHARATSPEVLAEELLALTRARSVFRIFLCDGDQPPGLSERLRAKGMVRFAYLHSMIATCPSESEFEMEPCVTPEQRADAATFMVANFFWRRETFLRNKIIQSTAQSPHHLFRVRNGGGRTIAAVMISESEHACGLYNLCVEPKMRNRGLGSSIVLACIGKSARFGKPLTLQTEASLASWYARLGFADAARVETLGISPKTWR